MMPNSTKTPSAMTEPVFSAPMGEDSSMYPLFKRGDILKIRRVPFSQLQVGDVIVFYLNEKVVVHPIIRRLPNQDQVITQGLNCLKPDPPLSSAHYLGLVYSQKPSWIHRIKKFFHQLFHLNQVLSLF